MLPGVGEEEFIHPLFNSIQNLYFQFQTYQQYKDKNNNSDTEKTTTTDIIRCKNDQDQIEKWQAQFKAKIEAC